MVPIWRNWCRHTGTPCCKVSGVCGHSWRPAMLIWGHTELRSPAMCSTEGNGQLVNFQPAHRSTPLLPDPEEMELDKPATAGQPNPNISCWSGCAQAISHKKNSSSASRKCSCWSITTVSSSIQLVTAKSKAKCDAVTKLVFLRPYHFTWKDVPNSIASLTNPY